MGTRISILLFFMGMDGRDKSGRGGNTRFSVDSGFFYVLKEPVFTLSRNCILNAEV